MAALRYAVAVALVIAAFGPVVMGSRAWRRRLFPRLYGSPSALVTSIIAVSIVVVVSEMLGIFGEFRVAPLTIVLAAVGVGTSYLANKTNHNDVQSPRESDRPDVPVDRILAGNHSPRLVLIALIATSTVTAEWMTRTVDALHHGITTVDSLWYHLPFAARFTQQGSLVHIHYVDTQPVVPFYPANSDLLHAVGIVFVSNDFLSTMMNMGWLALILLAAWCIGRPFGVAPLSLTAACVFLGTPGMVATQPGGAYDDVVGLGLFLASIAILTNTVRKGDQLQLSGIAIAALAAGLACGTKYTMVGPVAVLTIGTFVVCRRRQRIRAATLWSVLAILTGGFWYFKDWALVGSPLPSLAHLGPFTLPSPPITDPYTSISHYLLDVSIWDRYFFPGLRSAFGPASWAVLICSALGTVCLILWGRSALYRMVAIVGGGSAIAFLFTPQFLGPPDKPIYFVFNLRYGAPAVIVGLVLFPLIPVLRRLPVRMWVGLGLLGVLGVTQLDETIWPLHIFREEFGAPVTGVDSWLGLFLGIAFLVGGVAMFLVQHDHLGWRPRKAPLIGVLILVLFASFGLQRYYMAERYRTAGVGSTVAPEVVKWAQNLRNQRIAVDGPFMMLQYPYYGSRLSNYVQYLAQLLPNGGLQDYQTCTNWLTALHNGHFNYLITFRPIEQGWATADVHLDSVISEALGKGRTVEAFKLRGTTHTSACVGGGNTSSHANDLTEAP